MTVQRVQWTCPICGRRYAIPATAATPARCPECERARALGPASMGPVSMGAAASASAARNSLVLAPEEPEVEEDDNPALRELSVLAAIQNEVEEEAVRGPAAVSPAARHVQPSLRMLDTMAMIYAVLAGLAVVLAFAGLMFGLRAAFVMDLTPLRTVAIFQSIAAFGGGLVLAFVFFSFREVIRVLMEIEENTRPR
jgi:hypothetical protein